MLITWDKKTEAVYIYLRDPDVKSVKTIQVEGHGMFLDYDEHDLIIGIEILYVEDKPIVEEI